MRSSLRSGSVSMIGRSGGDRRSGDGQRLDQLAESDGGAEDGVEGGDEGDVGRRRNLGAIRGVVPAERADDDVQGRCHDDRQRGVEDRQLDADLLLAVLEDDLATDALGVEREEAVLGARTTDLRQRTEDLVDVRAVEAVLGDERAGRGDDPLGEPPRGDGNDGDEHHGDRPEQRAVDEEQDEVEQREHAGQHRGHGARRHDLLQCLHGEHRDAIEPDPSVRKNGTGSDSSRSHTPCCRRCWPRIEARLTAKPWTTASAPTSSALTHRAMPATIDEVALALGDERVEHVLGDPRREQSEEADDDGGDDRDDDVATSVEESEAGHLPSARGR